MDELKTKVANRIFATGMLREREGGDDALWKAALEMADFILALPEIAEALAFMRQEQNWADRVNDGHLVKPNLGASISTNRRDPV